MTEEFKIIIPARYDSSRFPGKPLADIHGKPMIQRVYEAAVDAGASEVVIATDSTLIGMAAEEFGAPVCMTLEQHATGTDRLCEVVDKLEWTDDTVVVEGSFFIILGLNYQSALLGFAFVAGRIPKLMRLFGFMSYKYVFFSKFKLEV